MHSTVACIFNLGVFRIPKYPYLNEYSVKFPIEVFTNIAEFSMENIHTAEVCSMGDLFTNNNIYSVVWEVNFERHPLSVEWVVFLIQCTLCSVYLW